MGNCHCRKKHAKVGYRLSKRNRDPSWYVNKSPGKDIVKFKKIQVVDIETRPRQPEEDSDAWSGSSICYILYNNDPALDTDAASCFESLPPSLTSASSFGSFSGPGCFSESSSSYTISDDESMVSHFPRVETE